jgi:hypothetical protein
MSVGQGSITFSNPPGAGGISVTGARNGLSVDGSGYIILGQAIGAVGDPAALIMDTEIDNAGFYLNFRGSGSLVLTDAAVVGDGSKLMIESADANLIEVDYNGTAGAVYFLATRGGFGGTSAIIMNGNATGTGILVLDPVTGDACVSLQADDNFVGGTSGVHEFIQVAPTLSLTTGGNNQVVAFQDVSTQSSTGGTNKFYSFWSNPSCESSNAGDTYIGFSFLPGFVTAGPTYIAWENTIGNIYMGTANTTGATRVSIRNGTTATAWLQLGAGQAAASSAPLKFGNGILQTTPELGAFEFAGNQIYFTLTAGTRSQILTGLSGAAAPATNIGVTIANYYGSSATNFLGTPVSWAAVVIAGTTYKLPLYT